MVGIIVFRSRLALQRTCAARSARHIGVVEILQRDLKHHPSFSLGSVSVYGKRWLSIEKEASWLPPCLLFGRPIRTASYASRLP